MSAAWAETVLRDKYTFFVGGDCCCLFSCILEALSKTRRKKKTQNITQHALWRELF